MPKRSEHHEGVPTQQTYKKTSKNGINRERVEYIKVSLISILREGTREYSTYKIGREGVTSPWVNHLCSSWGHPLPRGRDLHVFSLPFLVKFTLFSGASQWTYKAAHPALENESSPFIYSAPSNCPIPIPLKEKKPKDESQGSRYPFTFPLTPPPHTHRIALILQTDPVLGVNHSFTLSTLQTWLPNHTLTSLSSPHWMLLLGSVVRPCLYLNSKVLTLPGSCGASASHLHIGCLQICTSHCERKIPVGVGILESSLKRSERLLRKRDLRTSQPGWTLTFWLLIVLTKTSKTLAKNSRHLSNP